jgi:FtsH-binding integral membrane protein
MDRFVIITNRKRAIIALIHSVFFLCVAGLQMSLSHATAFQVHGQKATAGIVLLVIYTIVTTVLLILLRASGCTKERLYFAFCASSAGFGLVRILLGDPVLHANVLRVLFLSCAVLIGTAILRTHSELAAEAELH